MISMAQMMGPSRFHRPLRSSCIDMAISRVPSMNSVCTHQTFITDPGSGPLESSHTQKRHLRPYVFERVLDASHAEEGDPDGADGAQEVAVLERIVVHDAHDCDAWLVARMVELSKQKVRERGGGESQDPGNEAETSGWSPDRTVSVTVEKNMVKT